jgi:Methyltransferase domain
MMINKIKLDKFICLIHELIFPDKSRLLKSQQKKIEELSDVSIFNRVDVDWDWDEKVRKVTEGKKPFGEIDFADLATWIFASSLSNHRVIHQRIDEGAALWRAVKATTGPILEVGRAAGGSTLILLAASANRKVVSIDRGPFHAWCSDSVFNREDVISRLKLYVQSSREKIEESEFGLIFIDADHSYEGVCHDIATFWNSLKTINGVRPLMAFHDGAANPITYVEPVHKACEELLSDPSIARKVESWGSMLIVEKISDIDQEVWYRKQHKEFWAQYDYDQFTCYEPKTLSASLVLGEVKGTPTPENILGDNNFDREKWHLLNFEQEKLPLNEDNPVRLLKESTVIGEHKIYTDFPLLSGELILSFFIRPLGIDIIYILISQEEKNTLYVELDLRSNRVLRHSHEHPAINLLRVESHFQSGYFRVSITFSQSYAVNCVRLSIGSKNDLHQISYLGNKRRGLFFNLATLRYLE